MGMKTKYKRVLCAILSLFLMTVLCACGNSASSNGSELGGHEGEVPEVVFGTWYPHPEVSDVFIEMNSDGTCVIGGQEMSWNVESVEEDAVYVTAGDYYFSFTRLTTPLPILSVSDMGTCVKNSDLWNYMTEWYNPNTGGAFTLSLEELAQSGCNIIFENGSMTIEVLENDSVTYIVSVSGTQATVTTPDGDSIMYYSTNAEIPDDNLGENDSESEPLQKVDNVLVQILNDNSHTTVPVKFKYNAYGQPMKVILNQSEHYGNYVSYAYDENGNIDEVSVLGVLLGEPVFDYSGKLTGVKIEVEGEISLATLTYNSNGQITKAVMPRSNIADFTMTSAEYDFYYDASGRMIQRTSIIYDKNLSVLQPTAGFYEERILEKSIMEFDYDAGGRLISRSEHYTYDSGWDDFQWTLSETTYSYQNALLVEMYTDMFHISMYYDKNLSYEEQLQEEKIYHSTYDRMFRTEGLLNAEENNILDAVSEHIHKQESTDGRVTYFSSKYEYGSINIYKNKE